MTSFDLPKTYNDPIGLFHEWFQEAKSSESADPDAACLATTGPDGCPSARMVLVRRVDAKGFVFFTNENSRKGQQLLKGGFAALCYHWKTLARQVRVEGRVETVSEAESDLYFNSRHRSSRIGAWASQQSQDLDSRATLLAKNAEMEKRFEGTNDIPRPQHWHGFRILPARIEFWQDGEFRLHDRFVFTRTDQGVWSPQRLYP